MHSPCCCPTRRSADLGLGCAVTTGIRVGVDDSTAAGRIVGDGSKQRYGNESTAVVIDIRHSWSNGFRSTGNSCGSICRNSPCWRRYGVGECPGLGCAVTTGIRVGVDDSTAAGRIVGDGWRQRYGNESTAVVIDIRHSWSNGFRSTGNSCGSICRNSPCWRRYGVGECPGLGCAVTTGIRVGVDDSTAAGRIVGDGSKQRYGNESTAVVIDIRHSWSNGFRSTGNSCGSICRNSPCWRRYGVGECPGLGCAVTTGIRVGVDDSTAAGRIVGDGWRQRYGNESTAVVIDIRHSWSNGFRSTGNSCGSICRNSPCWRRYGVGECPGLGCAVTTGIRVGVDDSTAAGRIVGDGWRQRYGNESTAVVIDIRHSWSNGFRSTGNSCGSICRNSPCWRRYGVGECPGLGCAVTTGIRVGVDDSTAAGRIVGDGWRQRYGNESTAVVIDIGHSWSNGFRSTGNSCGSICRNSPCWRRYGVGECPGLGCAFTTGIRVGVDDSTAAGRIVGDGWRQRYGNESTAVVIDIGHSWSNGFRSTGNSCGSICRNSPCWRRYGVGECPGLGCAVTTGIRVGVDYSTVARRIVGDGWRQRYGNESTAVVIDIGHSWSNGFRSTGNSCGSICRNSPCWRRYGVGECPGLGWAVTTGIRVGVDDSTAAGRIVGDGWRQRYGNESTAVVIDIRHSWSNGFRSTGNSCGSICRNSPCWRRYGVGECPGLCCAVTTGIRVGVDDSTAAGRIVGDGWRQRYGNESTAVVIDIRHSWSNGFRSTGNSCGSICRNSPCWRLFRSGECPGLGCAVTTGIRVGVDDSTAAGRIVGDGWRQRYGNESTAVVIDIRHSWSNGFRSTGNSCGSICRNSPCWRRYGVGVCPGLGCGVLPCIPARRSYGLAAGRIVGDGWRQRYGNESTAVVIDIGHSWSNGFRSTGNSCGAICRNCPCWRRYGVGECPGLGCAVTTGIRVGVDDSTAAGRIVGDGWRQRYGNESTAVVIDIRHSWSNGFRSTGNSCGSICRNSPCWRRYGVGESPGLGCAVTTGIRVGVDDSTAAGRIVGDGWRQRHGNESTAVVIDIWHSWSNRFRSTGNSCGSICRNSPCWRRYGVGECPGLGCAVTTGIRVGVDDSTAAGRIVDDGWRQRYGNESTAVVIDIRHSWSNGFRSTGNSCGSICRNSPCWRRYGVGECPGLCCAVTTGIRVGVDDSTAAGRIVGDGWRQRYEIGSASCRVGVWNGLSDGLCRKGKSGG